MQSIEQERHSWMKLIAISLFLLAYGIVTVMAGDGDIEMNFDNPSTIAFFYIAQSLGVILLFILPAVLFAIFWTKSGIHYLGITVKPSIKTILLASSGMLFAMPLINWCAELNQHMQLPEAFSGIETWMKNSEAKAAELTDAFTKGTSVGKLILNLIVVAFMAAVSEELFFRGMVQKVLIECFKNKHIGVWMGAILFSAFHMQFYGFFPRMLMGAYLGYMFLWSGSIWPGMLTHFINNGIAVLLIWLANRGSISVDADKLGVQEGGVMYVIISVIMVTASLLLVYKTERKNKRLS